LSQICPDVGNCVFTIDALQQGVGPVPSSVFYKILKGVSPLARCNRFKGCEDVADEFFEKGWKAAVSVDDQRK